MAVDLLRLQSGWPTDLAKAYRRYGKFLRRRGRVEDALGMLEAAGDTGREPAQPPCMASRAEVLVDQAAAVAKPCFV